MTIWIIIDSIREVLHRDLSPTNIFLVDGVIKIADFGLGKNLNTLTSHQTMDTASLHCKTSIMLKG